MSDFPDFRDHGYQIIRNIGHNRAGGRVTYQALHLETATTVVIKQFQFAKVGTIWAQYDCYNQEIQVLRGLNHPNIPRYLESFQTADGFCMVQEYKDARPLSVPRSFDPEEVKQIAIAILEILVYLQNRIPAVIHRDIKPENILVDDDINVFLVDFGFARIGDGEVAVSSVVKGTVGFMPPEQLFNRELTEASDLYGLGATLICLLTQTKSLDIGNLVDIDYHIHFKHLVPKLNIRWVKWLEKMVEPRPKDRFPNAATALEALQPIPVSQLPEVQLSHAKLELKAPEMGAKITQKITVKNPIITRQPLQGTWEVAPHVSDPPHTPDSHAWIRFDHGSFVGNEVECLVTIDTSKLRANSLYQRQIRLQTNALPKTYTLDLKIETAPLPIQKQRLPYDLTTLLWGASTLATWVMVWMVWIIGELVGAPVAFNLMLVVGAVLGFELAGGILAFIGMRTGAIASTLIGFITTLGIGAVLCLKEAGALADLPMNITLSTASVTGMVAGFVMGTLVGLALSVATENFLFKNCSPRFSVLTTLVTATLGVGCGLGLIFGFFNLVVLALVSLSGLSLAGILLYQMLVHQRLMAYYRHSERYLIKP